MLYLDSPASLRATFARFSVFILAILLSVLNILGAVPLPQTPIQSRDEQRQRSPSQRRDGGSRTVQESEVQESGFVTYADGGSTACRDMTESEVKAAQRTPEQLKEMRVITPRERAIALQQDEMTTEGATGLTITLRSTAQLDNYPAAKNAFIRAAATWEARIKNPITVVIDVDYGPTRFGATYPAGVLGSTGTPSYIVAYDTIRTKLVASASSSAETSLYNALPFNTVSTDLGFVPNVAVVSPLMRAFGLIGASASITDTSAPAIGFNSNFTFDFDPSDGITPGSIDFDAVAVHEMGHALGFVSNVGFYELSPTTTKSLTVWDLFRFRPGIKTTTFATGQRILSSGGEQRFFNWQPEIATSTGRPNATGGDGRQASHWKADEFTGVYIGIMDPTLGYGERKTLTNSDLQVLESIGYRTANVPLDASSSCLYNLSATSDTAVLGGGTGSVNVTASANTCAWTATSNVGWLSVTSGASGTGSGTVAYSVQANTGGARSGTITIGGQSFIVYQAGCTYTFSYASNSFPAAASTGSVSVTASSTNCGWAAYSNSDWITVTSGGSGTGNGTVNYSVATNPTSAVRTGSLIIGGYLFTITQAAGVVVCSYNLGTFTPSIVANGGTMKITVGTSGTCTWNAVEAVAWLTFTPTSTFTGSGSVTLAVAQNTSPSARSTVITIAGIPYTFTQKGR